MSKIWIQKYAEGERGTLSAYGNEAEHEIRELTRWRTRL